MVVQFFTRSGTSLFVKGMDATECKCLLDSCIEKCNMAIAGFTYKILWVRVPKDPKDSWQARVEEVHGIPPPANRG